MSIFGGFGQNKPQQQQGTSLFGQNTQQSGSSLFGPNTQQQPQPSTSPFGQNNQQQGTSLFGQNQQQQSQPQGASLFGQSQQQQPPQQGQSLFGQSTTGGIFGQPPQQAQQQQQPQQQKSSFFAQNPAVDIFGQSTQQPNQNVQTQQQQQTDLQFGQSQQRPVQPIPSKPLWDEATALGPVYRSIPDQMSYLAQKWSPLTLVSPFRTYLYQKVDEESAPFYQPGPEEDPDKWEEAVMKRPGPDYVPVIARGFWELGKRAQRQREYIARCNIRLHEINNSLDAQLKIHNQEVASRFAECRRKHIVASQRIISLAAKVQILRSRGYSLDNAEEELKMKLEQLERQVFDPMVTGREQEIWARMIGIREKSKQLQMDIERTTPMADGEDDTLDEATIKAAKNALQAYDTQLTHLQKELKLVQDEFADWEKGGRNGSSTIR